MYIPIEYAILILMMKFKTQKMKMTRILHVIRIKKMTEDIFLDTVFILVKYCLYNVLFFFCKKKCRSVIYSKTLKLFIAIKSNLFQDFLNIIYYIVTL